MRGALGESVARERHVLDLAVLLDEWVGEQVVQEGALAAPHDQYGLPVDHTFTNRGRARVSLEEINDFLRLLEVVERALEALAALYARANAAHARILKQQRSHLLLPNGNIELFTH